MLGDFQGEIACVDDVLPDAVDFVSENEGIFLPGPGTEGVEGDGMDRLLDGDGGVTRFAELPEGFQGVSGIFPRHAFLRAEGRLVQFGGRRDGADAAEPDLVGLECIRRAERGTHVVGAADVVQDLDEARGGKFLVLGGGAKAQFDVQRSSVAHVHIVK